MILGIVEILVIILFGVFVRITNPTSLANAFSTIFPLYQDMDVMMLIGFGFLMAFSKSFSWSSVTYTFFINALIIQLYILLNAFWQRAVVDGFNAQNYYIYINERTFVYALHASASMFVCMGAFIGRVGPLELLIISLVHIFVYTVNEVICIYQIKAFDVGGGMTVHTFGAYAGVTASLILNASSRPSSKPKSNYFANLFALIGALFLWMFFPSFNFGYGLTLSTQYTLTQIVTNTIISLTGSCLATFITSAYLKEKFTMTHILNATISGGVVMGSVSGIIVHPSAAITIGFLIGIVSTVALHYLTPYLEKKFGLFDSCGIHSTFGLPGLIGGILSAIAAASFAYPSAYDAYGLSDTYFPFYSTLVNSPYKQGGLQLAATFTSLGFGVASAIVSGILVRMVHDFGPNEVFNDGAYFEEAKEYIDELGGLTGG